MQKGYVMALVIIFFSIGGFMFFFKKSKNSNLDNSSGNSDNLSLAKENGEKLGVSSVAETRVESISPAENTTPAEDGLENPSVGAVEEEKEEKAYIVTLKTTKGDITIALNTNQTPKTVQNFVDLSKNGFYNDTIFHRVIEGFMIQGGCPEGTGMGGPGYKFADEPFTGEYTRGTVAMANSGPDTNGSQFFIMHADYPLPKNYVIFGKVTNGMEVVDAIATAPVDRSLTGEMSKPKEPVSIVSVEVSEK